jgi:5-(carboxyamino)imidazole ribonucleotide mutase
LLKSVKRLSDLSKPLVGIVMGSDSDLPIMKDASSFLDDIGIGSELKILSAHRTPQRMVKYAKSAREKGIRIIIAGAGGSAHLPGMIASLTTLPVIGVPILSSKLKGIDSFLSIVQMPPGVPVACVAINGALNAAILACQILALDSKLLESRLHNYKKSLHSNVVRKSNRLQRRGANEYLRLK